MNALDDPALTRLWDLVSERLQRNGLAVRGAVTMAGLDRSERFALAGLVGRPITGERARVDLTVLDARLRCSVEVEGLVAALSSRRGPLIDRPGQRTAAAARRAAVWEAARSELSSTGLGGQSWVEPWLETIRPIVGRVPALRQRSALVTAVRCLARLPDQDERCGRTELANRVAGNSHALDDGRLVAALVLRGVALRMGADPPETPGQRRALWERAGVLTDEVSTTVLTLGLRPAGDAAVATAVRQRNDAHCEAHLTLRDLRRLDRCISTASRVWVCENPRVLEAAMDAGTGAAMVCTSGNPTVVVTMLLERLAQDGAQLVYRGDFDWPGVAIANRIISAYRARPWRMSTGDYELALSAAGEEMIELPPLEGRAVAAVWDHDLSAAMARAGRAVHEEALLDLLVNDLVESGRPASDTVGPGP